MVDDYFKLRCLLRGHTSEVRGITVSPNGNFIATVSRDRMCIFWRLNSENVYESFLNFSCGEKYAITIKYFKNNDQEYVLLGGLESTLQMRSIIDGALAHEFKGHSNCVSCIEIFAGNILTGSWDCSIKLWNPSGSCLKTFTYHSAAVWCLCSIGSNFLSGSADSMIVLWENGFPAKTFFGHDGPVRDLALLRMGTEFLSCSNDGTIKCWNIDSGQCTKNLTSHNHFVYSIATFPGYFYSFVSCGEEKIIKVWKDLKVVGEILVPGISNWCVSVLPNSDIILASSCSDVFIFTRDNSRAAKAEEQEIYDQMITSAISNSEAFKSIDIDSLPTVAEGIAESGSVDGQTRMLRQGNQIVIYQWSQESKEWVYLGNAIKEVQEESKNTTKVLYNGVEYDYVVDVELENGQRLKLPYNNGQDPDEAARTFLDNNNLEMFYHKQVIDFILANIPSASNYQMFQQKNQNSSNNHSEFPIMKLIFFRTTNVAGLFDRIATTAKNINTHDLAKLKSFTEKTLGDSAVVNMSDFPWDLLNNLFSMGDDLLMPVLDMIKQLILIEEFFIHFFVDRQNCFHFDLIEFFRNFTEESIEIKCQMLAVRAIVNCFEHGNYHQLLSQNLHHVNSLISSIHFWLDPKMQIAVSSLIFNFSVIFHKFSVESNLVLQTLDNLVWILDAFGSSLTPECLMRVFSAIANIVSLPQVKEISPSSVVTLKEFLSNNSDSSPKIVTLKNHILKHISL